MNTDCSFISPVSLLMKRTSTKSGAWIGHVLLFALFDGVLRLAELVRAELDRQGAGEVLDW